MTTDVIDIEMLNSEFKKQGFSLKVKPVGSSTSNYWLNAKDNSYALKVPKHFIQQLSQILSKLPKYKYMGDLEPLKELFENNFLSLDIPSFCYFPKLGFIAKDYAEFYVMYDEYSHDIEFSIGKVKVKVSHSSSLQFF